MLLNAAGGECVEDFERLREDPGLAELIGHGIPSPEAARQFLYQFHAKERTAEAQQQLELGRKAYIPGENGSLAKFVTKGARKGLSDLESFHAMAESALHSKLRLRCSGIVIPS